jgi:predicted DNA-binding protein YlxM (UPF0122 family)
MLIKNAVQMLIKNAVQMLREIETKLFAKFACQCNIGEKVRRAKTTNAKLSSTWSFVSLRSTGLALR